MSSQLLRTIQTLRHLRAEQVAARLLRLATARFDSLPEGADVEALAARAPASPDRRTAAFAALAQERQRFRPRAWRAADPDALTFLSDRLPLGHPPRWSGAGIRGAARDGALWEFHLHYLDWLWDVAEEAGSERAARVLNAWLEAHPRAGGAAWSPYTASLRLWNLLALYSLRLESRPLPSAELRRWAHAAACHALWVARHLEWEHRGNHLLENLLALRAAEAFFGVPLRPDAGALLVEQLEEQYLPGGCHFERSPSYDFLLLRRLQEAARLPGSEALPALAATADRSRDFLRHLRRPDGTLPLLGDSVEVPAAQLDHALGHLSVPALPTAEERDGHQVVRTPDGDYLLFDVAPSGPAFLGAHQHADLLGLELFLRGTPLLVDGGGGHYGEGDLRTACRAAGEHVGITVDGRGCSDPWKSFRLARRGSIASEPFRWHRGVFRSTALLRGAWDGLLLQRTVQFDTGRGSLAVHDALLPIRSDSGQSVLVRRTFPFYPGVALEASASREYRVHTPGGAAFACRVGAEARVEAGRYWRRFGEALPRPILTVQRSSGVPGVFHFQIGLPA